MDKKRRRRRKKPRMNPISCKIIINIHRKIKGVNLTIIPKEGIKDKIFLKDH